MMIMRRTPLLAAAMAVGLAGCSPGRGEANADGDARETAPGPVEAPRAASKIRQFLTPGDVGRAALAGELACAFSESDAAGPLLVATADVTDEARAEGVLRLGPSALRLRAEETGGFNAMVHGASFTSGDLAARIIVTSETPTAGGESPPLPARLEISADAGTQLIDGEWACGP
jgi:hypothetical protein